MVMKDVAVDDLDRGRLAREQARWTEWNNRVVLRDPDVYHVLAD